MKTRQYKYLILTLCALLSFSRIVPAQTQLPPLPIDSRIQKGTLGCGVTYYMVTDPTVKGYADVAIVQRDEPLSEAKALRPARMAIFPTRTAPPSTGSARFPFTGRRPWIPRCSIRLVWWPSPRPSRR